MKMKTQLTDPLGHSKDINFSPDLYYFIISFHLLIWGLACSCFSKILKYITRLFIWDLSYFLNVGTHPYKLMKCRLKEWVKESMGQRIGSMKK
jgi:xanthine/uracil permease